MIKLTMVLTHVKTGETLTQQVIFESTDNRVVEAYIAGVKRNTKVRLLSYSSEIVAEK